VQSSAPITNWVAITSSADGSKLAAAVIGGIAQDQNGRLYTNAGLIYTSADAGATWAATSAPATNWYSIASSADGTVLAAVVSAGPIYTSTNSGRTWTKTGAPIANWYAIASSADGRKLAAAGWFGPIYTSVNSGVTWIPSNLPQGNWSTIASSADGSLLLTSPFPGHILESRSTPQPKLSIVPADGNITVSWIVPSTNFVLQWSPIGDGGWSDVSAPPVLNLTNLKYEVVLSPTNSQGFYRLENR
jgi:hypothetical protein